MDKGILSLLARLEETSLSLLLRESGLAFFSVLTVHSLAMALVVGINVAAGLLLLVNGKPQGLKKFAQFYEWHRWALVIVVCSGLALLLAYPAKALTNPVFYFKLAILVFGLMIAAKVNRFMRLGTANPTDTIYLPHLAVLSLVLWAITISAGRFLAYTNSILLASSFY